VEESTMGKTLLYRLFGLGKVPKSIALELESEGMILVEEGIGGSVSFKNFRGPGKRHTWRKYWFSGSLVMTSKRVIAFAFWKRIFSFPLDNPGLKKLSVEAENANSLCISFDVSDFHSDMFGQVAYRFATPHARLLEERLRASASGR
jgi:hypothetical protein